jgi:hypothetical protein
MLHAASILCRAPHSLLRKSARKVGIDPTVSARALWLKSHQLPQSPASNIAQTDSASTVG